MSKYWDPAWERPTYELSFVRPNEEVFERLSEELRPDDWEDAPESTEFCLHNGRSCLANFGPDAILLVPAPNRVLTAPLQETIGSLNYYFICTRPRIRARDDCRAVGRSIELSFDVLLDDGSTDVLHKTLPLPPNVKSVGVTDHGATLCYELTDGEALHDAAITAQALFRKAPYEPSVFDLEVHYIGRARGVVSQTCALDRLETHPKYQAVLEDLLSSPHRNRDPWLVLGAGTTMDVFGFTDEGVPLPPDQDMIREKDRVRSILSKARRIDITEALLINCFKPPLNDQHTGELDLSSKTFKPCYDARLTGLLLVFPTGELGVALYTDPGVRKTWHVMTVCLHP
jgi:hypothetical protein